MIDVVFFYLFACIPVLVGFVFWAGRTKVHWGEWIGGSAIGFALAGLFHLAAIFGATGDRETWSGYIVKAVHYPRWVEQYQQMHTRTVGSGKDQKTEIYFTTEYRTHPEKWRAYSSIDSSHQITKDFYDKIATEFGNRGSERGFKPGFYSGDGNIYPTRNIGSGERFPITDLRRFENKIKATPTTFSFAKVPPTIKVFDYPKNIDAFISDRLVGSAALLDVLAFDQLNARIGPKKKANLILVGFGDKDSSYAKWQEAAWVGGKKNDVVLCWGGPNNKPTWAVAFGWTDSKTTLRNLESIALEHGVTNKTTRLLEEEIFKTYRLKDWDKAFAHIRVPAPAWAVISYFIVATLAQIVFWFWAHSNDLSKNKESYEYSRPYRRSSKGLGWL